jgi:predicted nucleic acid-binding protein
VKAVVDTNVVAYLLLGTEAYVQEARAFLTSLDEAHAPAVWEAEPGNVLWMGARHAVLTIQQAGKRLGLGRQARYSFRSHPNSVARRVSAGLPSPDCGLRHFIRGARCPRTAAVGHLRCSPAKSFPRHRGAARRTLDEIESDRQRRLLEELVKDPDERILLRGGGAPSAEQCAKRRLG